MRKLSKRERMLASVFFFILLIAIGIEFLVYPSLDKINRLKSERADLQLQRDQIEYFVGTEAEVMNQIKELKEQTNQLSKQLPSVQSSHLYWEWIEQQAEKSGVKIVQMQEEPPNLKNNDRLIHLSITGDFSNTVAFIEAMNRMPYIYALSEATFQSGDQLTSTTLTLYISAYQGANADHS